MTEPVRSLVLMSAFVYSGVCFVTGILWAIMEKHPFQTIGTLVSLVFLLPAWVVCGICHVTMWIYKNARRLFSIELKDVRLTKRRRNINEV